MIIGSVNVTIVYSYQSNSMCSDGRRYSPLCPHQLCAYLVPFLRWRVIDRYRNFFSLDVYGAATRMTPLDFHPGP